MALLQTSFLPGLRLGDVTPDLVLLVVVSWSLLRSSSQGLPLAVVGGMVLDLLSGGPFGAVTLSLVPASALTSLVQQRIARDSPWLPLAAGSLAGLLYNGFHALILRISGRPLRLGLGLAEWFLPSILWNALLMYPVYALMRRLHLRTAFGQAE